MVLEEYKDYFTDVYETDDLTVAVCNAEANRAQLSDMDSCIKAGNREYENGICHQRIYLLLLSGNL